MTDTLSEDETLGDVRNNKTSCKASAMNHDQGGNMKSITTRRLSVASGMAALIPMLAAGLVAFSGSSYAQQRIEQNDADLTACGIYNAAALDHRPIPDSIGGPGLLDSIAKDGFKTPATMLGAPDPLDPVWYTEVKVTPEQAKAICEKKLTAVYLDWSGVPYNLAMRSGAKAVFSALGIKIIRFADYSFNANGMAGVLAAILPLNPDILVTGGTVNAAQFAAILKPALDQGITVVAWSLGSPTMKVGQDQPLKAMVTYDFYNLGLQMADAVHETWPDGANFGYIHWINDVDAIHARENGLLDGLKKYPNIKIITNGDPSPSNSAGYADPSSATAFTQAFLTAHPEVNVLFAPWEDPPAIGQAAAIKALHLEDKVKIATMDLGNAGASQMRHNGIIAMDMAQDVYDGGRLMAMTAALAKMGWSTHSYVMVPTFPVTTKTDMQAAWDFMHGPEVTCPKGDCSD
jgi:ribose transport system substrate-binding protein